jgi:hypothetical protein
MELQVVFAAIAASAARLCDAPYGEAKDTRWLHLLAATGFLRLSDVDRESIHVRDLASGELEITLRISAVAACCSRASASSN